MKSILVVSSDAHYADIVCEYIAEIGHMGVWAGTLEAAEFAIKEQVDAAIIDFNMDKKRGTDLLPLQLPHVITSMIPSEAMKYAHGAQVINKAHPFSIFSWIDKLVGRKSASTGNVAESAPEGQTIQDRGRAEAPDRKARSLLWWRTEWEQASEETPECVWPTRISQRHLH